MPGGNVFMIEGDDIALPRESGERIEVRVVANRGQRDHLRRGGAGALGQQTGFDAQSDGCLLHHPGQLPAPDYSNPITTIHGAAAYYSISVSPSKIRSAITVCTFSTLGTSRKVNGSSAAVNSVREPQPNIRSIRELSVLTLLMLRSGKS